MNVNLELIIRGLKKRYLTEAKCKIRFTYVGVNCKIKKWGKKLMEISAINGREVRCLMANAIKNDHIFF